MMRLVGRNEVKKKIFYEVYQENGCLDAMDVMKNRLVNNYCVCTTIVAILFAIIKFNYFKR